MAKFWKKKNLTPEEPSKKEIITADKIPKEKKKWNASRVIELIIDLFLISSILFTAVSAFSMYIHRDDRSKVNVFGFRPTTIISGSMEPTIQTNAIALSKTISYDDVKVGDIIVYKIEDKVIAHRVIEKTEEGIRTKGDNNNVQDAYTLKEENIRGKVVLIFNFVAKIRPKLETWDGIFIYIGLPITAILSLYVAFKAVEISKRKKKKTSPKGIKEERPKKEEVPKKEKQPLWKRKKEDLPQGDVSPTIFSEKPQQKTLSAAIDEDYEIPIEDDDLYEQEDEISNLFGSFLNTSFSEEDKF